MIPVRPSSPPMVPPHPVPVVWCGSGVLPSPPVVWCGWELLPTSLRGGVVRVWALVVPPLPPL